MESNKFSAIFTDLKNPYLGEVEKRDLKTGEILVKVLACPVHPIDRMVAEGGFMFPGIKSQLPFGVGFDGAGTVEEAFDEENKSMIGLTVGFIQNPLSPTYEGTYREYIYTRVEEVFPFPQGTDPETVFSVSNPITVKNIVEVAEHGKHKAIVHSAACSSIGKMMIKYCKKIDLPLINIVRRDEQVDTLKNIGAEYVLNSESESFSQDLKNLSKELGATAFFDPICGSLTWKILKELPSPSTAYIFDNMSEEKFDFEPNDLIFNQKSISYVNILAWIPSKSAEEMKSMIGEICEDLLKDGEIFGTSVYKTYPLKDFEQAFKDSITYASKGKILLKPHPE